MNGRRGFFCHEAGLHMNDDILSSPSESDLPGRETSCPENHLSGILEREEFRFCASTKSLAIFLKLSHSQVSIPPKVDEFLLLVNSF
jgi:hypothetical protein